MMKKQLLLAFLAIGALCVPCTAQNRIIENPLIEAANTATLDITKIELNKPETVLHLDAYARPKSWIRIVSGTYLQADGQKYMARSGEGIQLDSLFWMPDSGKASFILKFEPLPHNTKSFDFIESDCDDCFKLYGVDLTGKKKYPLYPEGLPAALQKEPKDGPVPDPIFKVGETTVNVHLLGFRKEMLKRISCYVNPLFGGQKEYFADVDPQSGVATFRFLQCGPVMSFLTSAKIKFMTCVWVAPGQVTDVYLDLGESGKYIVNRRNKMLPEQAPTRIFTTGVYSDLNSLYNASTTPSIYARYFSPDFVDYRMSADELEQKISNEYKCLADSISHSATMSEMAKEINLLTLQQQTIHITVFGSYVLELNYRKVNNLRDYNTKIDYQFAKFTPEHIARICNLFDINNPKFLMGCSFPDIRSVTGVKEGFITDLQKMPILYYKAQNNELLQADIDTLRSLKNPFFAEALEAIQTQIRVELEKNKDVQIEQTPAVAEDQLFEAIIAPYKGKVIFVDFWNTWCGPCRSAIGQTEPLKNDELKSDNLVWIYIANETSPIATYKTSIPKIQGKHFRLNPAQWKFLCEKFKIDGIPSYVLVEKDGTYSLRNDLRDHHLLKSTLLEKIK